jgi:alpha-L-fucosidase
MITFNMQTWGLLPVGGMNKGTPPASTFAPTDLSTDAWVAAAASFGAKYAILTATHRSGFALWPTASHNYSVRSSPWKNGQGDVLADFVASCRKYGLSPGVFWTQRFNFHFGVPTNGLVDPGFNGSSKVSQQQYDRMMFTQLHELAEYGFEEMWINGLLEHSPSGGVFTKLANELRMLFPTAICHSCSSYSQGADGSGYGVRWMGNEEAVAPLPSWGAGDKGGGDPYATVYMPPSCDAVLHEHCWFTPGYPAGKCKRQTSTRLLGQYLTSVGRACNLVLNIAPGTDGALPAADTQVYAELGKSIKDLWARPLFHVPSAALNATTAALARNITVAFPSPIARCDIITLLLKEDISRGQLVDHFAVVLLLAPAGIRTNSTGLGGTRKDAELLEGPREVIMDKGPVEVEVIMAERGVGAQRIQLLPECNTTAMAVGMRLVVKDDFTFRDQQQPRWAEVGLFG